jgi:hypothetical protein
MKLGMNVLVSKFEDGADFIGVCAKAGIRAIRLTVLDDVSIAAEIKALEVAKAKASLSLPPITPDFSQAFAERLASEVEFAKIVDIYEARCSELPTNLSLGVSLPEGLHYMLRVGRSQTKLGLPREVIVSRMNVLADVICKSGHQVVLPLRADDVLEETWRDVERDIVEIEMMMPGTLDVEVEHLQDAVAALGVPVWIGKAGVIGGYAMPDQQMKFLRKLVGMQTPAEITFLWSEPGSPRWEWTQNGKFLIDILSCNIMAIQTQRTRTGDPVVAGWKNRLRAEKR